MVRDFNIEMEEYWVIRVIKDSHEGYKKVVKEIPLSSEPTKLEIMQILKLMDILILKRLKKL